MKKTPLKRGTKPLKRGKPMKRSGRIKARGKSRFPKRRDPAFIAWIRGQHCCVPVGKYWWPDRPTGIVEPAHVQTRGAGGLDKGNTVPMCQQHHAEQHTLGIQTFQKKYGIDLKREAADYARRYLEETGRTA